MTLLPLMATMMVLIFRYALLAMYGLILLLCNLWYSNIDWWQVLTAFANAFHLLQPLRVPAWRYVHHFWSTYQFYLSMLVCSIIVSSIHDVKKHVLCMQFLVIMLNYKLYIAIRLVAIHNMCHIEAVMSWWPNKMFVVWTDLASFNLDGIIMWAHKTRLLFSLLFTEFQPSILATHTAQVMETEIGSPRQLNVNVHFYYIKEGQ